MKYLKINQNMRQAFVEEDMKFMPVQSLPSREKEWTQAARRMSRNWTGVEAEDRPLISGRRR